MATTFLTSLNESELKALIKEALLEILAEDLTKRASSIPEILDVKQAAQLLRYKLTTLYEKTSRKLIPHFKKGNKLYFHLSELQEWIRKGKVKTMGEIEGDAATYTLMNE